jgi:hypothetical protein
MTKRKESEKKDVQSQPKSENQQRQQWRGVCEQQEGRET